MNGKQLLNELFTLMVIHWLKYSCHLAEVDRTFKQQLSYDFHKSVFNDTGTARQLRISNGMINETIRFMKQ